jgi:hypothetical protein
MAKQRFSKKDIIDALKTTNGIKASAAEMLSCNRRTIDNYIERYPDIAEAYKELREKVIDIGEIKLVKMVQDETHPKHWDAVRFLLTTLGRKRGYGDSLSQVVPGEDDDVMVDELVVRYSRRDKTQDDE